jgi:hypothetical protein
MIIPLISKLYRTLLFSLPFDWLFIYLLDEQTLQQYFIVFKIIYLKSGLAQAGNLVTIVNYVQPTTAPPVIFRWFWVNTSEQKSLCSVFHGPLWQQHGSWKRAHLVVIQAWPHKNGALGDEIWHNYVYFLVEIAYILFQLLSIPVDKIAKFTK